MVQLTIQPLFNLLLVNRRQFDTAAHATVWQQLTGELDGFIPMHVDDIKAWQGQIIMVPLKEADGVPQLVVVERRFQYLVEVTPENGDSPGALALRQYRDGALILSEITTRLRTLDDFTKKDMKREQ